MSEIAVDFLAGCGRFSWAIERFGFPMGYSHCASVLSDGRYLDSRSDVLDGIPAGVHIRQPASEKWIRKRRATSQVSLLEYNEWEANLRAKITTEYDTGAILGYLEGKSIHTAGRWICSALVINALQHIKRIPYPLPVPAHEITPNSALLILATAGFTIGEEETQ